MYGSLFQPGGDSVTYKLTLNVVTITKTTKLLLSSSIPDIKPNSSTVCVKYECTNLYAKGG